MEISQFNIKTILKELNNELKSMGLKRSFITFGGSALILLNMTDDQRTTVDIDILDPEIDNELTVAALNISKKLKLNDSWLNSSGSIFSSKLEENWRNRVKTVFTDSNLTVYSPSKDDMILLKLYAYYERGFITDLKDIVALTETFKKTKDIAINASKNIFKNKKRLDSILADIEKEVH